MLKILIYTILLIFSFSFFTGSVKADNESSVDDDYYVGLKAFDDGFYDVAEASLKDFLERDGKSPDAGFALYLLYQIYMYEKDFKKSQEVFNSLDEFKDKRFNTEKMKHDKMFIAAKVDCKQAENMLISSINDVWYRVYLDSGCNITEQVIIQGIKDNISSSTLYYLIDKVQNNKKYMSLIYSNLTPKKTNKEILNYFGRYFASKNMMDEFWKLYSSYKDEDLVSIALNSVWKQGDYAKYINMFQSDVKNEYKLPKTDYCRMIEASDKNNNKFSCDIIDNCIEKNNPNYIKTKLVCYIKNEDKEGINNFIISVPKNETTSLCGYAKYLVGKKLYSADVLYAFRGCSDKEEIYETLYQYKDSDAIIKLVGNSKGQLDYTYLALAYALAGKETETKNIMKKISEPKFSEMVKNRVGFLK